MTFEVGVIVDAFLLGKENTFVNLKIKQKNKIKQIEHTYIDAYTLDSVALLRWICFRYVSIEFFIIFVPFYRIKRFLLIRRCTGSAIIKMINSIVVICYRCMYWSKSIIPIVIETVVIILVVVVVFAWAQLILAFQ